MKRHNPADDVPFVVLEGADGAGKTRTLGALRGALTERGVHVLSYAAPPPAYGELRAVAARHLAADLSTGARPEVGVDLERALHVTALYLLDARIRVDVEALLPDVRRRTVILCDRWLLSTMAYQRDVNAALLMGGKLRRPHYLVLVAPLEVLLARVDHRGEEEPARSRLAALAAFYDGVARSPGFREFYGARALDGIQANTPDVIERWALAQILRWFPHLAAVKREW